MINMKLAMDEFNRALMRPTEHPLRENMDTDWENPNVQGGLERPVHGEEIRNEALITSSDWGADADRIHLREDRYEAQQVRQGLQQKLQQLVNSLYVQPNGQNMTVKQFLAHNPVTALFQSTDRSVRLMGNRIRQELSDTLQRNYTPTQIAKFREAFGSNVTDWLVGKSLQAAIKEHTSPTCLPPRDDQRRHLDEEAQNDIAKAKGVTSKFLKPKESSVSKFTQPVTASLQDLAGDVLSITASAEKLAWSNSLKNEVVKRFSKSPSFPQDDATLGQFLDSVERLVPPGPKAKAYILYLCGQHFNFNPPAWQPGEDDAVIRPLIYNFDKLVTKGKLSGQQADINSYKALDQLKSAVQQAADEAGEGAKDRPENDDAAESQMDRFDVHRTKYLPQDLADIKAGSTLVAEVDGYAVYKIKQNPDEKGKVAAQLLCNNGINKVSWCVGRGTLSYLDQGPFYVFVKGGRSRFAMSSVAAQKSATIWNAADTPVWVTTSGGGNDMPNLQKTAQASGIPLDMSKISSLPTDLVAVLTQARQHDSELAVLVPETHLVSGDTAPLDKTIMATPIQGLVSDLKSAFSSERSMGIGAAVMGRCVALHYDFSPEYSMFDENLLVAYIEMLAGAGQKLPTSLEDALVEAIQAVS